MDASTGQREQEASIVHVIDVVRASIGKGVVVDYSTNSGKPAYAKGRLISVEGEKIVIVNRQRLWMIALSQVLNFVVDREE